MSQQGNELFALHLGGKMLDISAIRSIERQVKPMGSYSRFRRIPKKIYQTRGAAKSAIALMKWLPQDIRDSIEIVRYIPAPIKTPCYPPSGRRLTP